jgi:hypothetical protein|uniref:Uncharacterized protein n=1 Tax=Mantoniella tinhauana virus 1 TaxID=3111543 RepID=A0AB38ZM23_9VIRU
MIAFIILALIDLYLFMQMGKNKTSSVEEPKKGWTVFGTMGCGWTRKQLDYMKKNGKEHTFVDCDKGGCDGMKAYPTLMSPDGEKSTGYKEV